MRDIVQPDPENERRFATVRRVSEINLGLYRTLFQPFVRASVNEQTAEWMKKLSHAELPFEIFSERNPLMQQVAQLAEQVRQQRRPVAPDNPFLAWQAQMSDGIIAALDGYRDQRDSLMEKIFLAIYSSPALQAMVGLGASDEPVRQKPGLDTEHVARIQERIAELKASIAEGGPREAAIRALLYIGLAGSGADERMFNTLRQIRAENEGLTLQAFKQTVREQYFKLQLDCEGALGGHSEDVVDRPGPAHAHAGGAAPNRPGHRRGDWRTRGAAGTGRKAVQHGPAHRPAPKGNPQGNPQASQQGRQQSRLSHQSRSTVVGRPHGMRIGVVEPRARRQA